MTVTKYFEIAFLILIVVSETFGLRLVREPRLIRSALASSEEENAKAMSRPPVIPFDGFARDDLPDKKVSEIRKLLEQEKEAKRKLEEPAIIPPSPNPYSISGDRDRPTGYANDIDDDPNWVPSAKKDDFTKVLKDIYIGSEYDSDAKKDARYVVRNITGFSVAIGIIFTLVWYAFPGRFISYKGSSSSASSSDLIEYVSPDELLSRDLYSNQGTGFEDTKPPQDVPQWQDGTPARPDQRIPMDPSGYWKPPTGKNAKEIDM